MKIVFYFHSQGPIVVQKCFEGMPKILIKILRASCYDSKVALNTLNADSIPDIEEFVEEHREHILEDSVYAKSYPFVLLPGHKAIILAIPKRLAALQAELSKQRAEMRNERYELNESNESGMADAEAEESSKRRRSETTIQQYEPTESNGSDERNESTQSIELVEYAEIEGRQQSKIRKFRFLTNDEIEIELSQLIKKLEAHLESVGLPIRVERTNISDFFQATDRLRCRVACSVCGKVITVHRLLDKNHWAAGNLTVHYKGHRNDFHKFDAIDVYDQQVGEVSEVCVKEETQDNLFMG